MHIHHVAIWTKDIERLRSFYEFYFNATAGERYVNTSKGFSSYFLSFESGAKLEVMQMETIPDSLNDPAKQFTGLIHIAISVGSETKVDAMTERIRQDGFTVVGEPRRTGDGFYESVVLDPDGNRVEITA